jgi:hypothetical protein
MVTGNLVRYPVPGIFLPLVSNVQRMLFVIDFFDVVLMAKLFKGSNKYLNVWDVLDQGHYEIHAAFTYGIVVEKFGVKQ